VKEIKYRIKYSKTGIARFTSHLDVLRALNRTVRRAGLPVAFSAGFNPKPQLAFGPPLPLGVESESEYFDLELTRALPEEEVKQALQHRNRSLAEMAREIGCNDYFENPEVMYSVLKRVYEVAENGGLCCLCGNENIEMEIFPGHLELRCDTCKVTTSISAQTEEDGQDIQDVDQIILPGSMTNLSPHKRGRRKGPSQQNK